jgi:hypothetical protein
MKKTIVVLVLGGILLTGAPIPAHAHGAAAAALALGAFATFGLLATAPLWAHPHYAYAGPVYYAPPAYYAPAPTTYAPPPQPPLIQREVVYPHGKHVLYGDGVTTAYQWVWVPNPPAAPPAPPVR